MPPERSASASCRTKVGPLGPAGRSALDRPIRRELPDARMAPGTTSHYARQWLRAYPLEDIRTGAAFRGQTQV